MDHKFKLKKALPKRPCPDLSAKPTAEQVALVHWLKAHMLLLLLEYLDATDQSTILASDAPFHLFELSDELCRILRFEGGCVVLLELLDVRPKLVWSDEDSAILQRVPVDSLRAMCCALAYFVTKKHSFTRLTA